MNKPIIEPSAVKAAMDKLDIDDLNKASIRQIGGIVKDIETTTGTEFIHFQMGIPGFSPCSVGVAAEHEALDKGVASRYPDMEGTPELKNETARFVKAFINADVSPEYCIPTVGSMQGVYAAFTLCSQIDPKKDTILFIDPGFSVQKTQAKVIGVKTTAFDLLDYREEKLGPKLEGYFREGNISAIVYSNPNNPTWMCLTEGELRTIGEMANKHDVIVIEDLAYLAMDFRSDMGIPFQGPYQPSVAHYTDNFIMMLSASKIFSYAGQRIAMMIMSDNLYNRHYNALTQRYDVARFGQAMIQSILYCLSSGTAHTAQYALAAMFKAASDGDLNFVRQTKEYGDRTRRLKDIFLRHGFHIIYDKDLDEPIADGFFFTVGYKDVEGGELLRQLLHYGISAIVLSTTGSEQQGLRICSSTIKPHQFDLLDERLAKFNG